MPESVDRILTSWTIDGTGPLTRSIADVSTSGRIETDAPHWRIENFLPIETQVLHEYLMHRATHLSEMDETQVQDFLSTSQRIGESIDRITSDYHNQFSDCYHSVDPDTDCRLPRHDDSEDPAEPEPDSESLLTLCDRILTDAAFQKLSHEEIEQCVGVASHWGVPLHVNFGLFKHLAVYARGDIVGQRCKRAWRKMYQMEMVDVPIYQRLVVLFQLSEDHQRGELLAANQFHLRIFKNIPKQDVDMLLPGTKVRLSKFDQAKVIVPSLGGWLFSLQKISRFVLVTLALAAYYSTALVIGLTLAAIAYLVKSFFSYFQTKNRYLLDLTRNLYFQKLDTNAGAAFQIIQQSNRQLTNECVLAYYCLATESESISRRRLRRKCERILRESIALEIDFRIDRTVDFLLSLGVAEETPDGKIAIRHQIEESLSVNES